jgi:uncharacterized protein
MIVGVMSDTHGHMDYMTKAAEWMIKDYGVESVVHLGDDYSDAMCLSMGQTGLIAVPGIYETAWEDKTISHRLIRMLGGISFLLSHTHTNNPNDRPDDINPEKARLRYGVEVLLHGHTHQYRAEKSGDGLVVINPGHLKSEEDRGFTPSFAVLDAKRPHLNVKIVSMLTGKVMEEHDFTINP